MNAELRRNLWVEITPTRLVLMPIALAAVFAFFSVWAPPDGMAKAALVLYAALVGLWGTQRATESVLKEVRGHTWDGQRMSVSSPWALVWGKLVGSTSFAWYGGLLCLGVYVEWTPRARHDWRVLAFAVLAGALAQATGLFIGLAAIMKDRAGSPVLSSGAFALACAGVVPFAVLAASRTSIPWYGLLEPPVELAVGALGVFLAWVLANARERVRAEMGERALPIAWIGFGLFLPAFVAGFDFGNGSESSIAIWAPVAAAAVLMYASLLAEPKDTASLRRWVHAAREKRWRHALEDAPGWALSLALMAVTVSTLALLDGGPSEPLVPRAALASTLFFAGRDVAFVLWLNFSKRPARADVFAVVCLALLYGVVPGTFAAMEQPAATAVFWPRTDHATVSLTAAALECLGMWWLVAARWPRTAPGTLTDGALARARG